MHDSRLDPSFGPKQDLKITMMEEYSRRYANLEHTMAHCAHLTPCCHAVNKRAV